MSAESSRCPKCGGHMETGYVIDFAHSTMVQERWVEGLPEPSFWVGLKIRKKKKFKILSYRCVKCGFLESYATEETK